MKFDQINLFVEEQIEVLEETLIPAAERVEFTSGGALEDVWCETQDKATELWCYEFAKHVREFPGQLLWGAKPQMTSKRFQSRSKTAYMDNVEMYCVWATFAIRARTNVAA